MATKDEGRDRVDGVAQVRHDRRRMANVAGYSGHWEPIAVQH